MMQVKNLSETNFDILVECFLLSFDNYFVKMSTDVEYYRERWQVAEVNYNLSYGMFDDEQLVGFVILAIDEKETKKVAYNILTGVIPSHRGQKIVQSIYEFAVLDLSKCGIKKCILQVIIENKWGIKSYQKIGFEITKYYKCFEGELKIENTIINTPSFEVKKVAYSDINWSEIPNQDSYYWENNFKIIKNGNYDYYQIWNKNSLENKLESFFVINPTTGYIAQFEVLIQEKSNKNEIYQRLFSVVKEICSTIKINNIDIKFDDKIDFLNSIGVTNIIDQYEMELSIK